MWPLLCRWVLLSGPGTTTPSLIASTADTTFTPSAVGTYAIRLYAYDGCTFANSADVTINALCTLPSPAPVLTPATSSINAFWRIPVTVQLSDPVLSFANLSSVEWSLQRPDGAPALLPLVLCVCGWECMSV